jgi:hypothetical protein
VAISRKYGWNGEVPAKNLVGQAQVVMFGMSDRTMRTAKEWTEIIGPNLKTRQDPYRVVLYYILGLKKLGVIATQEFDINAVTVHDNVKHGITVKSDSAVVEREVIPEPEPAGELVEA